MGENVRVINEADDRLATMQPGDFIILTDRRINPNRAYKVSVLIWSGNGFAKRRVDMDVAEVLPSKPMDVAITREGYVGYILRVTEETDGPQLIDWKVAHQPMKEKHDTNLKETDFVMFAGRRVRKGDFCQSMYPTRWEWIVQKVNGLLDRRCLQVMYVLSPSESGGKVKPVKGFTVKSVTTEGKYQKILTSDGRVGINLISMGGMKYL